MSSTPPPPNPAPAPDDGNGATGQGGIDRDVNSILANLNQEQLASIVAAAVSMAAYTVMRVASLTFYTSAESIRGQPRR